MKLTEIIPHMVTLREASPEEYAAFLSGYPGVLDAYDSEVMGQPFHLSIDHSRATARWDGTVATWHPGEDRYFIERKETP